MESKVKKAPTKKIVTIKKPKPLPLSDVKYDFSTQHATIKFPNSKYGYIVKVYNTPTDNCQLYCVANFEGLLNQIKGNGYEIPENEKPVQLEHILYNFSQSTGKALMLIDIHESIVNSFEKLIDNSNITLKQSYTSSNGSEMYLFIIRTDRDEFEQDNNDDYN